ncbi:MAG: hypothetical protein ACOC0P_00485, partial [Planctomycetota bacterium]
KNVRVEGGAESVVRVAGDIDVSDLTAGAAGGEVEILGDRIAVDNAIIDASGAAAGGEILIGGDYQGQGETPTAKRTFIGDNAEIKADATRRGDGGRVIVWSDEITAYTGDISAQGGRKGGDGGFVEVSGKEALRFDGTVSVRAPEGKTGTILLDPRDIFIQEEVGPDDPELGDNQVLFADGIDLEADFTLSASALEALDGDVLLQANRDIELGAGVTLNFENQAAGERVEFIAGRDIDILGDLTTAGGDLILTANSPLSLTPFEEGSITVSGTIDLAGGTFSASGTSFDSSMGGVISAGAIGSVASEGSKWDFSQDVTFGELELTGGMWIDAGGSINLTTGFTAGDVDLMAESDIIITGDFTTGGTTALDAGQDIAVTGSFAAAGETDFDAGRDIRVDGGFSADDAVTMTAGNAIDVTDGFTAAGDVEFDAGAGGINLTGDGDAGGAFTSRSETGVFDLNGNLTAGGAIEIDAVADLNGNLTSDNAGIVFREAVVLDGTGLADEAVRITSGRLAGHDIIFEGTVDGAAGLILDAVVPVNVDGGIIEMRGAVGETTALTSVDAVADEIRLSSGASTSEEQVWRARERMLLSGTFESEMGPMIFDGAVELTGATTVMAAAPDRDTVSIRFTGPIDSSIPENPQALTIDANDGIARIEDVVGNSQALSMLEISARAIESLASATTDGAQTWTATDEILLAGGTYVSTGGSVAINGDIALIADTTIRGNAGPGLRSIDLTGDIDGGRSLTLEGQDGDIVASDGAWGTNAAIASVDATTTGNIALTLESVITEQAQTWDSALISMQGDFTSLQNSISFSGDAVLTGTSSISAGVGLDDESVTFFGLLDGTYDLSVVADGTASFEGLVGSQMRLSSLHVTADAVSLPTAVTTEGLQHWSANQEIVLEGRYESQDGTIEFLSDVALVADTQVLGNADRGQNSIVFGGTVEGPHNLTLSGHDGVLRFNGAVGETLALASLDASAGDIVLPSVVRTNGLQKWTAEESIFAAGLYESLSGAVEFIADVNLRGDTTVRGNAAQDTDSIRFAADLDGAHALTLDGQSGDLRMQGDIGGRTGLDSLILTSGGNLLLEGGSVTITGALATDTNVELTGGVEVSGALNVGSLELDGAQDMLFGGDITSVGDIRLRSPLSTIEFAQSGESTNGSITIEADRFLLGGMLDAAGEILIDTNTTELRNNLSSNGSVEFTGDVIVDGSDLFDNVLTIKSGGGDAQDITFGGRIDDALTEGITNLVLEAGPAGDINFGGDVGSQQHLASLRAVADVIALPSSVTTEGMQTFDAVSDIFAGGVYTSDSDSVIFEGDVLLTSAMSVFGNAAPGVDSILFQGNVDGPFDLALSGNQGNITMEGAVGSRDALSSLTLFDGGSFTMAGEVANITGALATFGEQELLGRIDVASATQVGSTTLRAAGGMRFDQSLDADNAIVLESPLAAIELVGPVTSDLGSVTVRSDAFELGGMLTAAESVLIESASSALRADVLSLGSSIEITGDAIVDATGLGDNQLTIATGGGVGDDLTFGGTIDDVGDGNVTNLVLNAGSDGNINFTGDVGGTRALASLEATGSTIDLPAVVTTDGLQSWQVTGETLASGAYTSLNNAVEFNGNVTLTGDTWVYGNSSPHSVLFTGLVDGAHALTLDGQSGDLRMQGDIGGRTGLDSLILTSGGNLLLEGGSVTITGALATDTNVELTGGVEVSGALNVGSLELDGAQDMLFGGDITSVGDIRLRSPLSTIEFAQSGESTNGSITIEADRFLLGGMLDAAGEILIDTNTTELRNNLSSNGSVEFTGDVIVDGSDLFDNVLTIKSGGGDAQDITFGGRIDDALTEGITNLVLEAGPAGDINFGGDVGSQQHLASLRAVADVIALPSSVTTEGMQTFDAVSDIFAGGVYTSDSDSVIFEGDVLLTSAMSVFGNAAPGVDSILFQGNVDGPFDLALSGNQGNITMEGAVGSRDALSSLTLFDGGSFTMAGEVANITGALATFGEQELLGRIDVASATQVGSTTLRAAGGMRFDQSLDADNAIVLESPLAAIELVGPVTSDLGSVTVRSDAFELGGMLTAAESVLIESASSALRADVLSLGSSIEITGDAIVDATGLGDNQLTIATGGGVGDDLTFGGTIDDVGDGNVTNLVLNAGSDGNINFTGDVGGTRALASLEATGSTIDLPAVVTTDGLQSYSMGSQAIAGGSYRSRQNAIQFEGDVLLDSTTSISGNASPGNSSVRFTGRIDGPHGLFLDGEAGDLRLEGSIGHNQALSSLAVRSGASLLLDGATVNVGGSFETMLGTTLTGRVEAAGALEVGRLALRADAGMQFDDTIVAVSDILLESSAATIELGDATTSTLGAIEVNSTFLEARGDMTAAESILVDSDTAELTANVRSRFATVDF